MSQFINYSDTIFNAFCLHTKRKEIIDRKREIIDKIFEFYNVGCESILFVGFNPAILSTNVKEIYVAEVSDEVFNWLRSQGVPVNRFDQPRKFDIIVAFDEYLTFVDNEDNQKNKIDSLCKLANSLIITTIKDYKNQEFKDREFSIPALIRAGQSSTVYLEFHDHSLQDRNSWKTQVYEIAGTQLNASGPFDRRAMFFKQLAKFSADAGAVGFSVHKNLMYKSLIKKNYEHVISIRFDNGT